MLLPFPPRNLNDDIIPQVGALQVTANIVFGYATYVLAGASCCLRGHSLPRLALQCPAVAE